MYKKLLCFLIIGVLSVSVLAACGAENNVEENPTVTTVADANTEVTTQIETTDVSNNDNLYVYADTEALTAIEQADDFSLQVSDTRIETDVTDEVTLNGNDAIIARVQNLTDKEIFSFKMLVFGTDANGKGTSLGTLSNLSGVMTGIENDKLKYSNAVYFMSAESADLAANSSAEYMIQCDSSKIETVNILVYSYIDSSGREFVNENYTEWLGNTYEGIEIPTSSVAVQN